MDNKKEYTKPVYEIVKFTISASIATVSNTEGEWETEDREF